MSDLDKKTELLVWLLDHRVDEVHCRQISTGADTADTLVCFISEEGEKFTVPDWDSLPCRNEYDYGIKIEFSPHHAGMFRVRDPRAEEVIKARDANEELVEEKAELEARLKEVNGKLKL